MKKNYCGHYSQIYGVEEHRLVGGKGDGMRLLQVRSGSGLDFTVSADRCADISRLSFRGYNIGYFAPCGYVSPQYYDRSGDGFLSSFTAGFLTTCGLTNVGIASNDQGEELPLHGSISNIPADNLYVKTEDNIIEIGADIYDASNFSHKIKLKRKITCTVGSNEITIVDIVENLGNTASPLMFLYHTNIGYPLLDENAELYIPSMKQTPRNEISSADISNWMKLSPPDINYKEKCYYHDFDENDLNIAAIFNKKLKIGVCIHFENENLDHFVQWKMFGKSEYVLGLEPSNCHVDGRDVMRREKKLKFINPNEIVEFSIKVKIIENEDSWNTLINKRGV